MIHSPAIRAWLVTAMIALIAMTIGLSGWLLWPQWQVYQFTRAVERGDSLTIDRMSAAIRGTGEAKLAAEALIEMLNSSNDQCRAYSVYGLYTLGSDGQAALALRPQEFPRLLNALKHDDKIIEGAARNLLGLAGAEAVPVLIEGLGSENPTIRKGAALALAKIGPLAKDAVPVLIGSLGDSDLGVRQCSCSALGEIGADAKAAILPLLELKKDRNSWPVAADALAAIGSDSLPYLTVALLDNDPWVRKKAIIALAKIGPKAKDAVPALRSLLKNDPLMEKEISFALKQIGKGTEQNAERATDADLP